MTLYYQPISLQVGLAASITVRCTLPTGNILPSGAADQSISQYQNIEYAGAPLGATNLLPAGRPATALTNSTQGTVTNAPGLLVPYSATRKSVFIFNRSTGNDIIDVGSPNVVVGSGIPIGPGNAGFQFQGDGAAGPIWAVSTGGNTPVSFVEA
jgi:hypothetical protein